MSSLSVSPNSTLTLPQSTTHLDASPRSVRVIRSAEDFHSLQPHWDAFLTECGVHNLSLSYDWIQTWLRYFPPSETLILIVQDDTGRWLSVAPFQITPSRTGYTHRLLKHLQFLGSQPTIFDWMEIPIRPDANTDSVLGQIAQTLLQEQWDLLELWFCPNHPQLETLSRLLKPKTTASRIWDTMPIPYVKLPDSEEEYSKTRRKKTRLEVNRHRNRIQQDFGQPPALVFHESTDTNTNTLLDTFFDGHIAYWGEKGIKSEFKRYPVLANFYKDLLAQGRHATTTQPRLIFSTFKFQDKPVSYHLGFQQGNCYLSHITHYDHTVKNYSPGTLHMDALVFDTIRKGMPEFEFGRGDEPYKKLWTQDKKPLWNLRLFRNPFSKALWDVDITLKRLTGRTVL